MRRYYFSQLAFLVAIAFCALAPIASVARADIDGDESSVEKDRAHFGAHKKLRKNLKYNVYDLESDRHTVHEFVDLTGRVFAITWQGAMPPNLPTLLGNHHGEFLAKRVTTPKTRGQRNFQIITTSKIQVVQAGHMGHWTGSVYLIGRLPPGLTLDQLE